MPNPTRGQMHIDAPLTTLSVARLQAQENFIAGNAFPFVAVQKRSDKYFTYNAGDLNRREMRRIGPYDEAPVVGYKLSNDSYFCEKYGAAIPLVNDEVNEADDPLRPEQDAIDYLNNQALMQIDSVWATAFFQPAVWTTDWDGVASNPSTNEILQWDQSSSTPVDDINKLKDTVSGIIGKEPNIMVVGKRAHRVLLDHDDILERIKYVRTASDQQVKSELANLFGVEKYLRPMGVENTAEYGQTDSFSNLMTDNDVFLGYAPPSPSLKTESCGYVFAWKGRPGASRMGTLVRRYEVPRRDADFIEMDLYVDMKVVSADAGAFIDGAVSASA